MKARKFETKIGGIKHTVVEITPSVAAVNMIPSTIHQIHVLDRSGSMAGHINKLVDQAQETLKLAGENDIISVIDFSSAGKSRVVLKGAKNTDDVQVFMDSMRSAGGLTCFSEPLTKVEDVINDLAPLTTNVVVTLFTDGEPVVPWGPAEEIKRTIAAVEKYSSSVLAVNAIGYGQYYNQEFLKQLTATSQFGVLTHSSNIEEYLEIFKRNLDAVQGMVASTLDVSSVHDADIVYTNKKVVNLYNNSFSLRNMDKDFNAVYVIFAGTARNTIEVNGEEIDTNTLSNGFTPEEKEEFFYAYASKLYYAGRRQVALDIMVNNIKDKALADEIQSAFTVDEVATAQNSIEAAFVSSSNRFKEGKVPPKYMPKKNAYCVLDLLTDLQETEGLYVPFSDNIDKYARIGKKAIDNFSTFTWTTDPIVVPVQKFVWNEKQLNLSIGFSIPGTVSINPKSAKRVGLPEVFQSKIHRTHTFIKDGALNIKKAHFLIKGDMYGILQDNKVKMEVHDAIQIEGEEVTFSVVIDLIKLPVINRSYMEKDMEARKLLEDTKELITLKAQNKTLGWYLADVYERGTSVLKKENAFEGYTAEQIQVLGEHGISKTGDYNGVQVETPSKDECDSYMSRCMVFQLKGSTSIPKVTDAITKKNAGKKLNFCECVITDQATELEKEIKEAELELDKPSVALRDFISEKIAKINKQIAEANKKLNIYKFATILNNDWIHGLEEKDGAYTYSDGEYTLNVRVDRITNYY